MTTTKLTCKVCGIIKKWNKKAEPINMIKSHQNKNNYHHIMVLDTEYDEYLALQNYPNVEGSQSTASESKK